MRNKGIYITMILLSITSLLSAQDSSGASKLSFTGSLDAYYRYNFQNAKDSGRLNNYTSFTNAQNSFEIGMASVRADYTKGKVGVVADLGFGKRAEEFSYNDGNTVAAIKQAFVFYAPSEKIKFTMGKWFTHVGYEVPDAYLNRNYSMDYLFSYGPFFHTGIKADVTVNKNFGFMAGVSNPTDMTSASFSHKFFLAQLHATSSNSKINGYLNYVGGEDPENVSVNQFDLVITGILSDKFNIGYNGSIKMVNPDGGNDGNWWGSAIYLNFDPCSSFGMTARGEYFDDKDGIAGFSTSIFDATLSANIKVDNLTVIPELRLDAAKDPIFFKNADTDFATSKSSASFILAAVFHF